MIKHPDYINRLYAPLFNAANYARYAALFAQIVRFGIVGVTAAAVHFGVVTMLVQYSGMHPLVANIVGFCFGFQVGYWGHRLWTFQADDILHSAALPRLLTVQLTALAANETLFYIFLRMDIPYQLALLIVLTILPLFTFVLSKFWVFQSRD